MGKGMAAKPFAETYVDCGAVLIVSACECSACHSVDPRGRLRARKRRDFRLAVAVYVAFMLLVVLLSRDIFDVLSWFTVN